MPQPLIRAEKIILIPLAKVKLNPANFNIHTEEQIDRLAKIIEYQGFRDPITISNRSKLCIAGEGRFLAAKKLGMKKIPAIFQDFDSEAQETAHGIADNAIHAPGWSDLNLIKIAETIPLLGKNFDTDFLGIKNLSIEGIDTEKTSGCGKDEIPEKVEAKSKFGDLYRLGDHRLMCGDSEDYKMIQILMDGGKVELLFTDPPYNQEVNGWGIAKERPGFKKLRASDLNDFDPQNFFSVLEEIQPDSLYVFTSKKLLTEYFQWVGAHRDNWDLLVMGKTNPIPLKNNKFLSDVEWLVFSRMKNAYWDNDLEFGYYKKIRMISCKEGSEGHPTQKQVEFIEPYIQLSCPTEGNVLDLFGGSGSTLIACEKTKRKCYMMEIEPHYVDVIVARWEKFTGKKAELLNGKTTKKDRSRAS